jgi:hypothetical protein
LCPFNIWIHIFFFLFFFVFFFFNRQYLLLSFGRPQLYDSEALQFTYGQYVVIVLADKP